MSLSKKLGTMRGYYISAHRRRMDFYSWKWRLLVILTAALLALFVNDYLQAKYAGAIVFTLNPDGSGLAPAGYAMADKLFYWFMTGVLFGIVALAVLNEGEFILGIRKMLKKIGSEERKVEREVGREVEGGLKSAFRLGGKPQPAAKRKAVKSRKK